jgi:flagellar hook protein FlgE
MASFYIPLTGLTSDSTALNTIANDLANMNTTAFKSQKVNFSDLFYQQIGSTGSGDPIQRGSGAKVASIATDFSTGSPNSTGVDTDVALQGNGFFVVGEGANQYLTRAGNFSTDSHGSLITRGGLGVMGYPAANGVINTNAPLVPINIPENQTQAPKATSSFGMTATLNSQAAVGTSTSGAVKVYDSLGHPYQATVTYTKTGNNAWSYSVSMPDTLTANSSVSGGGVTTINYNFGSSGGNLATVNPGTNLTITGPTATGTGTIAAPVIASVPPESIATYAADLQAAVNAAGITGVTVTASGGQLSIAGTGISTTGSVSQDPVASANAGGALAFDASGNLVSPATDVAGISFAGLSNGAATMNITWDLYGAGGKGTINQTDQTSSSASTTAVSSTTQNGYSSGGYSGFTIGSDGTVTASFDNGQKLNVGQLALASVVNMQGLKAMGNGAYSTTLASGEATVGVSGSAGLGTMEGGALEGSNVNISAEFSNLIIAQRAFEANSKAITTFDSVTQETINMIR